MLKDELDVFLIISKNDFKILGAAATTTAQSGSPQADLSEGLSSGLSEDAIAALAKRVAEQLSVEVMEQIAWQVVPDVAERVGQEDLRL